VLFEKSLPNLIQDLKMKKLVFLLLVLSTTANAQTSYKCVVNNVTTYQASPCAGETEIKTVDSPSEKTVVTKEELKTKAIIEESNARMNKLQSIADEKIRLKDEAYQADVISANGDANSLKILERQYLLSKREIYQELQSEYSKNVSFLNTEAQRHRQKAKNYENEMIEHKRETDANLLKFDNIGRK
jgi:hypothetical protein